MAQTPTTMGYTMINEYASATLQDRFAYQAVMSELSSDFGDFRSRIASLSVSASNEITSLFCPLGPVDPQIIDIDAMEWVHVQAETPALPVVLEFASAELVAA